MTESRGIKAESRSIPSSELERLAGEWDEAAHDAGFLAGRVSKVVSGVLRAKLVSKAEVLAACAVELRVLAGYRKGAG